MKFKILHFWILLVVAVGFCSCDKDGDDIYLRGFAASDLVASTDNVVLSPSSHSSAVLSLVWNTPELLSSDSSKTAPDGVLQTYLQVSATEDFAKFSENRIMTPSKTYLGSDLNTLAKSLGLTESKASPLYFRVRSTEGDNMTSAYSNVCQVQVTPYTIHLNRMSVLGKEKKDTVAYLYSPTENGVYTGYMAASAWQGCWFLENDGTLWGNYAMDGHAFELSNASDAWNCWFSGGSGDWLVTVDTKEGSWSAANLTSIKLNGEDMTYDSNNDSWSLVIKTTKAQEALQATADAQLYNKTTGTDTSTGETLQLPDTTVETAGTYTVTLAIGSDAQFHYTISEGDHTGGGETVKMPSQLVMYTPDGTTVMATLKKSSEGIYTGTYNPQQWENFKVVDTENGIWYGSISSDVFSLSSASDAWNLWFEDDFTVGATLTVTVNLKTMKWSYKE